MKSPDFPSSTTALSTVVRKRSGTSGSVGTVSTTSMRACASEQVVLFLPSPCCCCCPLRPLSRAQTGTAEQPTEALIYRPLDRGKSVAAGRRVTLGSLSTTPRGRDWSLWAVSGRLPHAVTPQGEGTGTHRPVRRGEQDLEGVEVLANPEVSGLGEPEVAFNDQERMLDLRTHRRLTRLCRPLRFNHRPQLALVSKTAVRAGGLRRVKDA